VALACWDGGFESESRRGHECLSLVSFVFWLAKTLRRADHSSRGVLPNVMSQSVIVKLLKPWYSRGYCASGGKKLN